MIKHYTSIFLSDTHFRTRYCQSKRLYKFLLENTCTNLFLNGDIVDTFLINKAYVDAYQCRCIELIKAHPNTFYLIGNHDEHYPSIARDVMSGVRTYNEIIYTSLSGKKCLITHGHQYDPAGTLFNLCKRISLFRRLYAIVSLRDGNWFINKLVDIVDWWLAQDLTKFRQKAVADTKAKGCNMVILGHTHVAAMGMLDGITYLNSGSWTTDKCSALVEDVHGNIGLVFPT